MARNKYPEETKKLILDVAKKLFLEKGYDDTTIQDIIDGLGGLTKGVIYHHFKNKEDILNHTLEHLSEFQEDRLNLAINRGDLKGFEKLQQFFIAAIKQYELVALIKNAKILNKTPRIIGERYLETMEITIPYIKEIIYEGLDDGSIHSDYPDEVGEIISILANIWIGVQLPNWTGSEVKKKFTAVFLSIEALGLKFLTEETLAAIEDLADFIDKLNHKKTAD